MSLPSLKAEPPKRCHSVSRWLQLLLLGVILFGMGQFEQQVFAGLTWLWGSGISLSHLPLREEVLQAGTQAQLTTHGLPVALTYRLLYLLLSLRLLKVLLRGQHLQVIVLAYSVAFLAALTLLLAGKSLPWDLGAVLGHQLLDFLCSPLAVLIAYPLVLLAQGERRHQTLATENPTRA
jgi:hypothetical protein